MAAKRIRVDRVQVIWEPDGPGQERCHVRATVSYPCSINGDRRLEWLTSGGLNGIGHPSPSYRREVEREQLQELRDHLEVFKVDVAAYDWAKHA